MKIYVTVNRMIVRLQMCKEEDDELTAYLAINSQAINIALPA